MPRRRKNNNNQEEEEDDGFWGNLLIAGAAVAAVGIGYLVGKSDGREEAEAEKNTDEEGGSAAAAARAPGPPPAAAAAAAVASEQKEGAADPNEKHICSVCLDHPSVMVFLECRHQATCKTCCQRLKECPICRTKIRQKPLEVYKV